MTGNQPVLVKLTLPPKFGGLLQQSMLRQQFSSELYRKNLKIILEK